MAIDPQRRIEELETEVARLREENERYEDWLAEADAALIDHLRLAGRPAHRGTNWCEALFGLPEELARLRADDGKEVKNP